MVSVLATTNAETLRRLDRAECKLETIVEVTHSDGSVLRIAAQPRAGSDEGGARR